MQIEINNRTLKQNDEIYFLHKMAVIGANVISIERSNLNKNSKYELLLHYGKKC